MNRHYVGSEIGQLKSVLLHRANLSLKRLTPSNCHDLLFDDVLSVEKALHEHKKFTETLMNEGIHVLLLNDLITEVCDIPEAKHWLLNTQISHFRLGESLAYDVREWLSALPHDDLAEIMTGGLAYNEIPSTFLATQFDSFKGTDFILKPLPNHLFTRDTSCWIYNGVSINPMAKAVRRRESNNLRAIYRWHPHFTDSDFHYYMGKQDINYDNATLEGGDVLVLGFDTVLIGISERTTPQGIECLAHALFAAGQAKRVIVLEMPKHRAYMHLDTVLTHLDIDTFSVYPDVINNETKCWSLSPGKGNRLQLKEEKNYRSAIADALGMGQIEIITTGGDSFCSEREQWNDANNVLTLRPGVVIGYEFNTYTNEKYDKAGIKILPIPGDQLSKGRGGPRCMSCPLEREPL